MGPSAAIARTGTVPAPGTGPSPLPASPRPACSPTSSA